MFAEISDEERLPQASAAGIKPARDGSWTDLVIPLAVAVLMSPAFLLGLVIYMARKLLPAPKA